MKKFFLLFFFVSTVLYAEKANLKIIFQDGLEYTESFDKGTDNITLVCKGNMRQKNIIDIQGFEQFENLTTLSMYFFQCKGDYSFLKRIKSLTNLGLIGCSAESFGFLTDLEFLEMVDLELSFDTSTKKLKRTWM